MEIAQIYRLINDDDLVYYGSTTNTLERRLAKHKWGAANGKRTTSRVLFGEGKTVRIELVEDCSGVRNRYDLQNRERYYIENNECVNRCVPNRTTTEYYYDNIDNIKRYRKNWRQANLHRICECGFVGLRQHHARHLNSQRHLLWEARNIPL